MELLVLVMRVCLHCASGEAMELLARVLRVFLHCVLGETMELLLLVMGVLHTVRKFKASSSW